MADIPRQAGTCSTGAVQLIQPFDPDLATEFEQRCNGMQNVEEASELDA